MIELQNLTKKFGASTAVDAVSFQLRKGQTLALIGPSGCGKTSTLKMINRLLEPSSGRILIDGQDSSTIRLEEMRRSMGYVIQRFGLFPHYTALENIAIVPRLLDWPTQKIENRCRLLFEQLKLPFGEYANKYPNELSGGEQQRVGIARALAADPPIILMDEPFGALDPITRSAVRKDFLNLEVLKNKTTIIVTHDISEAFELADRVCLLNHGEVQQIGKPAELLYQPSNDFVRNFLKDEFINLEWNILALQDILPHLISNNELKEHTLEFDLQTNLSTVISQLSGSRNLTGQIKVNNQPVCFNVADLFMALSKKAEA